MTNEKKSPLPVWLSLSVPELRRLLNLVFPLPTLTKRQVSILNFMDEYRQQNGYSPSIREVETGTGIAATTPGGASHSRQRNGCLGYLVSWPAVGIRGFSRIRGELDLVSAADPVNLPLQTRAETVAMKFALVIQRMMMMALVHQGLTSDVHDLLPLMKKIGYVGNQAGSRSRNATGFGQGRCADL